jgi:hypothetical protein
LCKRSKEADVPSFPFYNQSWRYSLDKEVDSTQKFAHLWQVLARDKPVGPVVSLTMQNDKVVVLRERPRSKTLASMSLDSFKGKQVEHQMTVKFGSKGSFNYTMTDLDTGERLADVAYHGSVGRCTSESSYTHILWSCDIDWGV